jgi:hypothetical protein
MLKAFLANMQQTNLTEVHVSASEIKRNEECIFEAMRVNLKGPYDVTL